MKCTVSCNFIPSSVRSAANNQGWQGDRDTETLLPTEMQNGALEDNSQLSKQSNVGAHIVILLT